MKVNAITIRPGNVLEYEGKLMLVTKIEIIQPGKGNAIIQVEMRDARTGTKTQQRFRTQETVERARLDEHEMQFLYQEGDHFTFMDNESFEQTQVPVDVVGEPARFLQEGMVCTVTMYEGAPLSLELPQTVTMTIAEADPVVKGQTASSSYKPAVLENGVRVMVPPHIASGTRIVINTADGTYLERAKD
ncbi:elongation factor P [Inquilinus sp. NPDC058860]|uniref:elongation factor P n=1 Tax=Inquilinus sp. NPDC058860 TaxID=3346652 RepID=UPI003677368B